MLKQPTNLLFLFLFLGACGVEVQNESAETFSVPAGQGSIGPNLAKGPTGTIVLSWMEPYETGHALRFSTLGTDTWEQARQITTGDNWFVNWADFPSVVPLNGATWAAHWLVSQPAGGYAYDVNISTSQDNGETWSDPFLPHTDGTPTEHGFVTLFPEDDGLGLVWLDGRKMVNEYDAADVTASGMTLRSVSVDDEGNLSNPALVDNLICDCCQTDVALTAEGPVAVYRDRTTEEVRDIYVARRVDGKWQPGTRVAEDNWEIPACPVNGPIVRASGQYTAVTWFTAPNGRPQVKAAWSNDNGRTFSKPVLVHDESPLGHIGAVILANGDLLVAWHQRMDNGTHLLVRRVASTGALGEIHRIHEAENVFAFSVPQMALDRGRVAIVWTNSIEDAYSLDSIVVPVSNFN